MVRLVRPSGARGVALLATSLLAISLMAALLAACGPTDRLYTDPAYGFSFEYPGGWHVQEGTSDVTAGGELAANVGVYDPAGTKVGETFVDLAMVTVYNLSFSVEDPWTAELRSEMEGLLAALVAQTEGARVEQALAQTTTAEMQGYVATYTFVKDGTPMRSTLYFLFDDTREYELTQQASLASWEAVKPALDAIVESFQPGRVD